MMCEGTITITSTPQGWECPKCGRIYSPTTAECYHCNRKLNQWSTTVTVETPYPVVPAIPQDDSVTWSAEWDWDNIRYM